ncbi:GET complex subunit get1 [Puccinia graminis f. sp. tritici]|uniref:GET complex subunit get1 n=1 Tax=Puccinia graminis f. sp. tritici TaxID=56615 RepID=A0A5B0RL11_PUCGR|nr:GET complex subunit get1 [Puccinia graminis f. sp. tritici]
MLGFYIFFLVASAQFIQWIGKTKLIDWTHNLYLWISGSSLLKDQAILKTQILKTKVEFQATSSQDQFAKWARLRRKIDKDLVDLEALNKEISSAKVQFAALFSSLLWTFTSGFQFVLISWYRRSPVFFLPQDWFPSPIVWILSFPSAPYGAVSTTVWTIVCKRALALSGAILVDTFGIFSEPPPVAQESQTPASKVPPSLK